MKTIFASLVMMMGSLAVQAMPCDTGYQCVSRTGKYKIELQRCRYVNDLHLVSASISNHLITGATLGSAFDGWSVGGKFLAFEVNLPTSDGSYRVLSVETIRGRGLIQSKYAEMMPEPLKVVDSESIRCRIAD